MFFHVLCCLTLLFQRHWMLEKLGDQILYLFGVSSFLHFCPNFRLVYQNSSCPISFLIQVPRMTNDRKETCEHTSKLQWNSDYILQCFRFLPIQCRCTLTWKWSSWLQHLKWCQRKYDTYLDVLIRRLAKPLFVLSHVAVPSLDCFSRQ